MLALSGRGSAQPLDAAARSDERSDLAITQEPVLRDRRERIVVALEGTTGPLCGGSGCPGIGTTLALLTGGECSPVLGEH